MIIKKHNKCKNSLIGQQVIACFLCLVLCIATINLCRYLVHFRSNQSLLVIVTFTNIFLIQLIVEIDRLCFIFHIKNRQSSFVLTKYFYYGIILRVCKFQNTQTERSKQPFFIYYYFLRLSTNYLKCISILKVEY